MARKTKRIEVNKKIGKKTRLKASRTGGVSISTQPVKGVTVNSKHGLRIAKSVGGVQLASQNGRLSIRGRKKLGSKGTNLNLSKSGLSLSQKFSIGTLNLMNPKRSSANIAGMSFRGKNAQLLLFIASIVQLSILGLKIAIFIIQLMARLSIWLFRLIREKIQTKATDRMDPS